MPRSDDAPEIDSMTKTLTLTAALGLFLAGCGTGPNQRIVTRTSTYMKAMTFGSAVGYPVDFAELERRYPELKGIVIPASVWVDEYEKMRREADERGTSLYEYRIPFGANLTIEVTGEPALTRTYSVPPTGYVHYPYLKKLRVSGQTPDELKDFLQRELAVYLKNPEVLIHINTTPYQPNQLQPFYQQSFGGPTSSSWDWRQPASSPTPPSRARKRCCRSSETRCFRTMPSGASSALSAAMSRTRCTRAA
jgi:hypothetical protein